MNEMHTPYFIVGDVTVSIHNSHSTKDFDIVIALDIAYWESVLLIMQQKGYSQYLPIDIRQLSEHQIISKKGMKAYVFIHPKMPQFNVYILTFKSLHCNDLVSRKMIVDAWGMSFPVLSIVDLIKTKNEIDLFLSPTQQYGIDIDYLRRCKETTPEQRLDWLAAAWEFVKGIEAANKSKKKQG